MADQRCVQCGRPVRPEKGDDRLWLRMDGSEVWLCRRPKCQEDFENDVPGKEKLS